MLEMQIKACDHSRRDAVVAHEGEVLRVIPGGYKHGNLTDEALALIAELRRDFEAIVCIAGRFTRDIVDHDHSHPQMLGDYTNACK